MAALLVAVLCINFAVSSHSRRTGREEIEPE